MKWLASAIAILGFAAASAEAGTYDVVACDAAPGGANRSWTFDTNDGAHVSAATVCPSSSNLSGLLATTRLTSGGSSATAHGRWSFVAPPGTTIKRLRLHRYLYLDGGTGWAVYGRQADGTVLPGETCTVQPGFDDCSVGGAASPQIDLAVNTSSIAYGFDCRTVASQCTTGATIHAARAAIYSAVVTIDDPTPPTIGVPAGRLADPSGYHRGTESLTFNGGDALGLKQRRLLIDGVEVAAEDLACDYTRVVPCADPGAPVTLSANVDRLADGWHTVEAAVVDAAGNETRSAPTTITVDRTGPEAPREFSVRERASTDASFRAMWGHPGGQVAPIVAAHWRLCQVNAVAQCASGTTDQSALDGRLPAYGAYTLSVALEDAAGNRGEATEVPLSYVAPAGPPVVTPTPSPTPTATPSAPRVKVTAATFKRSTRAVSVSGTASGTGTTVRLRLTYRVGVRRHAKTIGATLRNGRFSVRTRLSRAHARRAARLEVHASFQDASSRRRVTVRR